MEDQKQVADELSGLWTDWGWDKMAAIFQTAFWNAFSWMKMNEFLEISLQLVPKGPNDNISALVEVMAWHIGFDNGLAPIRWRAIIWTNDC